HDARYILERASARETAARVAAGALAKALLGEFGIQVLSHVIAVGDVRLERPAAWEEIVALSRKEQVLLGCADSEGEARMKEVVDEAYRTGDSVGGFFEVVAHGVPAGLGSHITWDSRLDGRLAQAIVSMQAVKGVEIGFAAQGAASFGSKVQDTIHYDREGRRFTRGANRAGGLEGGITNGQDLLFLGNSLLDQHLDENAFVQAAQRARFRPINAALAATQSPEQQLLFEYAVRSHAGIRTLVVGILDSQLTGEDHSRVVDLIGNRMVGVDRRFPVSEVQGVYGFSALDCAELEVLRTFPMAANRANAWKQVELLRRSMESMGMPQTAVNSMGRADDFAAAMEFAQIDTLDAQARSFLDHRDKFNAS